jgi:hypothetical protein
VTHGKGRQRQEKDGRRWNWVASIRTAWYSMVLVQIVEVSNSSQHPPSSAYSPVSHHENLSIPSSNVILNSSFSTICIAASSIGSHLVTRGVRAGCWVGFLRGKGERQHYIDRVSAILLRITVCQRVGPGESTAQGN